MTKKERKKERLFFPNEDRSFSKNAIGTAEHSQGFIRNPVNISTMEMNGANLKVIIATSFEKNFKKKNLSPASTYRSPSPADPYRKIFFLLYHHLYHHVDHHHVLVLFLFQIPSFFTKSLSLSLSLSILSHNLT